MFVVNLNCHAATACLYGIEIESQEIGINRDTLSLRYALKGDLSRLQIPELQWPRRADRLWEHTCFEAFLGVAGHSEYYEFNFSPSGQWAAYAFRAYRIGGPIDDDDLDPKIAVVKGAAKLELSAALPLGSLPSLKSGGPLRLGLAAVIEDSDGGLSYWALKHPPGKPDFHHTDNFVLEIQSSVAGRDAIAYTAKP